MQTFKLDHTSDQDKGRPVKRMQYQSIDKILLWYRTLYMVPAITACELVELACIVCARARACI